MLKIAPGPQKIALRLKVQSSKHPQKPCVLEKIAKIAKIARCFSSILSPHRRVGFNPHIPTATPKNQHDQRQFKTLLQQAGKQLGCSQHPGCWGDGTFISNLPRNPSLFCSQLSTPYSRRQASWIIAHQSHRGPSKTRTTSHNTIHEKAL